jgi:hypothetical protein
MDFTPIFIVGFVVLGIYKIFELFVRRKERLTFIEKLASLKFDSSEPIHLPNLLFEKQDSGSWPLRISLLLIGIGLGSLCAFFIQMYYGYSVLNWNQINMINAASICFFGGIGLFIAFMIELKQKNNSLNRDNN